jgi:hypothetical protein
MLNAKTCETEGRGARLPSDVSKTPMGWALPPNKEETSNDDSKPHEEVIPEWIASSSVGGAHVLTVRQRRYHAFYPKGTTWHCARTATRHSPTLDPPEVVRPRPQPRGNLRATHGARARLMPSA